MSAPMPALPDAVLVCTLLAGALTSGLLDAQTAHWAYRAPVRPAEPEVARSDWPRNPIDSFVLARLEAEGRTPAPRAEPARLLRRLHLDLIGLPPTPEEVEAFVADPSPAAYARVVDRLLASPRFGEHHARQWLDLARYADSNGFQADQLRDSWAYRDWVIDALNDDMPFDRFTIGQLAGDLLPEATLEQRIATGFHRTVTCNVEAGVHPEANRVDQVVDRVNTTATVWLGTTMECAQCHDHKYDPFSQRDYYRLFAFFNNTPLEVVNPLGEQGVSFDFDGPWMELPLRAEQQAELDRLEAEREALQARRSLALADAAAVQEDWEGELRGMLDAAPGWRVLEVAEFTSTGDEDHELLPDGSVLLSGRVPDTTTYRVRVESELTDVTALRLEVLTHPSLPGTGPGRGDVERPNFILSEFVVEAEPLAAVGNGGEGPRRVALHGARADHEQDGWPVAAAIDGKQDKGWAIGGGFFADHAATFLTREPVGEPGGTAWTFTLDQNYGRGRTIGRFRISAFQGAPEALTTPEDIAAIVGSEARTDEEEARLREYYLAHRPEVVRLQQALAAIDEQIARLEPDRTLVMVEMDEPRSTCVMRRGDYLLPGERVEPGTPGALHPFDERWPRNRLGLACWLVSPDNPLVARVTVNRWWSQIFGAGLVATEEDFGLRCAPPSHPELLDWLAMEFVASGWSRKHLLRTIVTSATYQQSSRRGAAADDPHNRLLGRGPRFRLSAEMLRDQALAASGLLSLEQGGPPVFPPQPDGLWRQTGRNEPKYVVATDSDRFRRGIYVIWRRAAPYPSFVLFDGPDRATCHPKRSRTNTPMQALVLMNDPVYVEAALGLAARALREAGDDPARLVRMFQWVLARRPTPAEQAFLLQVVVDERQRLAAEPGAAHALVDAHPVLDLEPTLDRTELAAWFHTATMLLNLDEAVTKG